MEEATRDDLLYGRLRLWQPAAGPRVSMDTVLLAAWVRRRARRPRFVELGSASGAVSLMLALRFPHRSTWWGSNFSRSSWSWRSATGLKTAFRTG
ncbi:hypothetical protein [Fretibacterium fastidiosum]|uniref:O-methyltransferase n=1 Tax=Fretibacterium fastidiosum TaxID=651822 RepID=A0AB94IXK9_9BACT|nr:hypothetical protein [Fretibacterium fastidiosum]CBL28481.1 hypothetical protein SY1_14210 [Fretibacterium fastidiosum]